MDCHKARELIEQRLREGARGECASDHDWSDLEAHLKTCSQCSSEWDELRRTRKLLEQVASDRPTAEEVETMWNAVLSAAPGGAVVARTSNRTSQIWRLIITVGSIAAVIGLAFRIGYMRYGNEFSQISALTHIKNTATTSRVYEAAENSGWGIPVHPKQFESVALVDIDTLAVCPMYLDADAPQVEADAVGDWATKRDAWNYAYTPFVSTGGSGAAPVAESVAQDMFTVGRPAGQSGDEQVATIPGMAPPQSDDASRVSFLPEEDVNQEMMAVFNNNMLLFQRSKGAPSVDTNGDRVTDKSALDPREPVEEQEAPEHAQALPAGRASGLSAEDTEPESPTTAMPQPTARTQTRIIKTGKLTIEVDSYVEASRQVESLALEHDAVVADTSAWEQDGGALTGWFEIRVAPDRFETLFASLKAIGRVEAENVKAADITANYVDLEARIATLRITEQRLAELITNKSFVDKMSALLEVEREMTRVRSQIELFTGRLRVMADQVALSTININLHEPARTVPSASLAVEVPVLDAAATAFGDVLEQVDGRLISGNTSKQSGGALKGTYEIRVSLARFGELLAAVEALGRVEERQVNDRQFGEAAAAWASDVQCHLSLVLFEPSRALPGGTVSIEVDGLDGALSKLGSALASSGGSIVSNRTTKRDDGSSTAVLTLRVPAGGFAELVDSLSALGRTTDKTVWGEAGSILGGAAAAPCDLSLTLSERPGEVPRGHIVLEVPEFEAAREKLSELVVEKEIQVLSSSSNQRTDGKWVGNFRLGIKSGQIESVLTRLCLLGRVASRHTTGIGLGDLSRCAPDTLGVIDLTLGEKEALTPPPERMGGTLRNRLREGLAGFYASLGLIAYGLIVIAPWLIIVLLVAWVVMRIQRRHHASKGGVGGSS